MDNCPKCDTELECEGGCSAHPDNWYCPKCRAQEWLSSGEAQKAFENIAEEMNTFADKLQKKQNLCQCCFCRHQRGIGK